MEGMFEYTTSFDQNLNSWSLGRGDDFQTDVQRLQAWNNLGNALTWTDVSNVEDFESMFEATTAFNLDLSSWTFGPGVSLKWMFKDSFEPTTTAAPRSIRGICQWFRIWKASSAAPKHFNAAIDTWQTTGVDSLKNVFRGTLVFNKPLTGWDTGSVTTLEGTFQDTEVFNQALTQFDLSSALSLKDTFRGSKKYNKYIQYWSVGNVRDFSGTFADAASFNNEIWRWNLAKATTTKEMFACTNTLCRFNRAIPRNGNKWKTHLVTDMTSMFEGATCFYWNIANWDVSKVVSMKNMFRRRYPVQSATFHLGHGKGGRFQRLLQRYRHGGGSRWVRRRLYAVRLRPWKLGHEFGQTRRV